MPHKNYAPVALFIYNRPDHLRRVITSLKQCAEFNETPILVFADGAKDKGEEGNVGRAREVAHECLGAGAVYDERDHNLGLAQSIIRGVDKVCSQYGRVIVIEDDLIVSPEFLRYMNASLDYYEEWEEVFQVSGYMFPISLPQTNRCFLLPLTTSWGWATWARAWSKYDRKMQGWEVLKSDAVSRRKFNVDGAFDFYSMLTKQAEGKIDSWAIRWYWSVFRNQGLVVYPPVSMIENAGFDGSGTHGWRNAKRMLGGQIAGVNQELDYPVYGPEDRICYSQISKYLGRRRYNYFTYVKPFIEGLYRMKKLIWK
ncbi:glycosyltransferase [Pseudomonadota bacterium]